MKTWLIGAGLLAPFLAASVARAAVINYAEPFDGDLSGVLASPTTIFLDTAGENTISGSARTAFSAFPTDFDIARVDLAHGITISSISVDLFGFVLFGGDGTEGNVTFVASTVPGFSTLFNAGYSTSPPDLLLDSGTNTVIGPLTDSVILRTASISLSSATVLDDEDEVFFSYGWTIQTEGTAFEPMPLPASALLLLAGLGVMRVWQGATFSV